MFTNEDSSYIPAIYRSTLYISNYSTARDLGQLQKSRNPLLYLSGRQDTTHVYLFNF